jgi:hypothetical protein
MLVVAGRPVTLDLFHQFVLEALAARGHDRHSGMDDVIDVARCEIFDRGHDRLEHVLLEILTVPMLDIGGRGAHRDAIGSQSIKVVSRRFDHGRAEQADTLAPAERTFRIAHGLIPVARGYATYARRCQSDGFDVSWQ